MNSFQKSDVKSVASSIAGITLLVAGLFGSVQAQNSTSDPREALVVQYGDLNLDSNQGAKVLLARLHQAAAVVCKPLESRNLSFRNQWQSCYDRAVFSAVAHINKPSVSAMYQASLTPNDRG